MLFRSFQKAVRSLEITNRSILWEDPDWSTADQPLFSTLPIGPNDERLWAVLSALRRNVSPEELSRRTGIDPWFLRAFGRITTMENRLIHEHLDENLMYEAKRLGFPDDRIAVLTDRTTEETRRLRDRKSTRLNSSHW